MLCTTKNCASSTVRTISNVGVTGWYTALALTTANVPVIGYHDSVSTAAKYALCNNTLCSGTTTTLLVNAAAEGEYPPLPAPVTTR